MKQNYKTSKWARINYHTNLPLGKDGKRVTGSREHINLSREVANEGTVLLKNNGLLPLKPGSRVAVFGKAQYNYIKGGTGSGNVYCDYITNIYEGLKEKENEGKISVFEGAYDFYRNEMEKQYKSLDERTMPIEPELPEDILKLAKAYTDTAIITISRNSGEDYDRTGEPGNGDFYLSREEEKMVSTVVDNFENIVVLINSGAQIDTTWFADNKKISAALYIWQGGIVGGLSAADILVGDVNPSGKLVDTFARIFDDYPSSATFNESDDYVKYTEDIYVGYRYFETLKGADEKVVYPFGYGLSYTDFEYSHVSATEKDGKIKVFATITNIGKRPGKEAFQVYYSCPGGRILKPSYELAGFTKTKLLEVGESTRASVEFDISDMASYDDLGKISKSSYILEKGIYKIFVGKNVRDLIKTDFEYVLNEDIIVQTLSPRCVPVNLEKRLLADGSYEAIPQFEKVTAKNNFAPNTAKAPETPAKLIDVAEGRVTLDEFIAQFSDDELIEQTYNKPNRGVANTFGMGGSQKYGIPFTMTADGPAGLRINADTGITTTAFPIATMLACTFNTELAYKVGRAQAREVKENNIGVFLAPALNIHRNPLCGRNFEYFSEDPRIAGEMAAAVVNGIQSQHIAASAKHLCVNNKETNRKESDSIVSERALREIYLKGFEICVKKSQPYTIMSSYNKVNSERTSECYDLITGILRGEWGFKGMVTTDWWNTATQYKEIIAGNDIRMQSYNHAETKEALDKGLITREEIEACVKRILEMIIKLD